MDAHPTHTAGQAEILIRCHIEGLRKDPFLKDAAIILISEKNTGFESARHWKIVEEYQPAYAMYENQRNLDDVVNTEEEDPGVTTTAHTKNLYARAISDALGKRRIYFYDRMVVGNPWMKPKESRASIIKAKLTTQMSNSRRKLPLMGIEHGGSSTLGSHTVTVTWSGKIGPDGKIVPGQNDDLVVIFGLCIHWTNRILRMDLAGFPYKVLFANAQHRDSMRLDRYGERVMRSTQ
jgi:hypothetical protein